MGIIAWIVLGGIAGWIASMIMRTNAEQGLVGNIVVGIIGAFLGGIVMNWFGSVGVTGFNVRSIIVSIVGACIALAVYKALTGRGRAHVA